MKKEKKPVKDYNGIEYESDEELMALLWMEELQNHGVIKQIQRAQTYNLSEAVENRYVDVVQMKTKTKEVEKKQVLLHGHEYTAEFKVVWGKYPSKVYRLPSLGKMTELFMAGMENNEVVSYIEVKPSWDAQNMERLFKINQKWMYEKYRIFVNLIKPHKLFAETFTPKRWLTTPTGKQRAINWPVKTIEQYLEE